MTKINGYLDDLRDNLEVLDEAIATAQCTPVATERVIPRIKKDTKPGISR